MPNTNARKLRRLTTEAEKRLWSMLRDRSIAGLKFRRQRPIGPFIADFACLEHRLIIEVDGGQHADSSADERRTAWLNDHGWRVIRFWNNDVLENLDGVHARLLETLERRAFQSPLTLTLPPQSGGSLPLPQAGEGKRGSGFKPSSASGRGRDPARQRWEGEGADVARDAIPHHSHLVELTVRDAERSIGSEFE